MTDERYPTARPGSAPQGSAGDDDAVTNVRVTVVAVRRVAAMAERALREQGFTDADSVLQDALAAALIAEDALTMEQAGDALAEPMALEALRMAKEALKAANKPEPAPAPAMVPALEPAPPAFAIPTYVPEPAPQDVSPETSVCEAPAAPEPAPEPALAPEPAAQDAPCETSAREAPEPESAPARSAIELPLRPPTEAQDSAPAAGAGRHARIDLPEIAPAPQPEPVRMPEPAPATEQEPAVPRARSERGFAIPYGPSAVEPGEDAFFAPGPQECPGALHTAPAGAAPDCKAPAGASDPSSPRKPKAAKRACAALAALLVVLVALVGAAWWGLLDLPEPVQHRIELLPDPHARQGRLNATEVDVAPGSYQLVLNQVATMEAGSRTLPIAFENPEANAYSSRLVLSLDGERVASTGMVGPGFYVEDVELARTLPQGEHELSATVYVYSGATQVNTMSANVKVRVK